MFMRTHASSRVKRKSFYRKSELHMFLLISGGHLCTKTVHQYGVSIQCSTKVHETFRPITQKLSATKTWDLEKLLVSQSFITFHFLAFFHLTVSNVLVAWPWKRSILSLFPTCQALAWFWLSSVKLYRNDQKGNKNYFGFARVWVSCKVLVIGSQL